MIKRNCLLTGPFIDTKQIFEHDNYLYKLIRDNINDELSKIDLTNVKSILEIGPSDNPKSRFNETFNINKSIIYHTLDIIDNGSTYTHDITKILENPITKYDLILLSEVLEHTSNPFLVINNIKYLISDVGKIFITFPFNFRLHGPLPDCWRISEFGFKSIIKEASLSIIKLDALILEERPYFPIHYTSIVTHEN